MKVLAERSNRIFFIGPLILAVVGFFIWFLSGYINFRSLYNCPSEILEITAVAVVVFVVTLYIFIERMFMPKILMEYDNAGIYIYKYKNSEPILLRFETIGVCGSEIEPDSGALGMETYSYERAALMGTKMTGAIKIQTDMGEVKVRGIKNVKEVEIKLGKIRNEFEALRNERYEAIVAQKIRDEELAELARHDPNT